MIPETVDALLLFVLFIVPGMMFELLRQRRRPPFEQTSLEEASRIVLWSFVFDAAGVGLVAAFSRLHPSFVVSPAELARRGTDQYWRLHYMAVIFTLASVCVAAVLVAALVHRSLNHDKRRGIAELVLRQLERAVRHSPGRQIERAPIWQEVLRNQQPIGADTQLTVIKKDGSMWMGLLGGYTPSDHEDRDLVLRQPVSVRRPASGVVESLPADWLLVLIPGREISEVLVTYPVARA